MSLIMYYFIKPYRITNLIFDNTFASQKSCKLFDDKRIDRNIRIIIRIIFTLWFTTYELAETIFLVFAISYYQYCPHQLTAEDSARLFSYSTMSYTFFSVSKYICVDESSYLLKQDINTIIEIHYLILLVGMMLLIVAHFNYIAPWVSGPIIMCGFGPMFAGTY